MLASCVALAGTISIGCHADRSGGRDGGGDDRGDVGDTADVATDGLADRQPGDSSVDAPAGGDAPLDEAADRSVSEPVDAGQEADSGVADALRPICAGLGKVEDPRGCSGVRLCDGAGNCVSRYTVFPIARLNAFNPTSLVKIITGPDGNLWFIDVDTVGRMKPTGDSTELMMPGALSGLAGGPDGNLWFTDWSNDVVGRVTLDGVQREFPHVAGRPRLPTGVVTGPDGDLWFTDFDAIGKMTTTGALQEFPIPTPVPYANSIAVGFDGNLWFTEQVGKIGRITTAGVITEFPVPEIPATSVSTLAGVIAAGPDGNLWFTEPEPNKIGRITPAGVVTGFPIPTANSYPSDIAAGPDGNLWFIEVAANLVGRITPSGTVTEFAPPTPNSFVSAICAGSDGAVWFTEDGNMAVGSETSYLGWLVRVQP